MLILAAALTSTWLIWSGMFKPLLLVLGAVSVVLTIIMAVRMRLLRKSVFALALLPRMFGFWTSLLIDIIKSNIAVAKIVLSPRLPIAPTLLRLKTPTPGAIGQATLANSITLSPGTITIDSHRGELLVHCVDQQSADELRVGNHGERANRAVAGR